MLLLVYAATLALVGLAYGGGSTIPSNPVHWRDLRDDRWPDPAGRIFQVSNSDEINALQDELEPGDAMIMASGEWLDVNITLTASGDEREGYNIYLMPEVYGETVFRDSVQILVQGSFVELRGLWLDGESAGKYPVPIYVDKDTTNCRLTNSVISGFNPEEGDDFGKIWWIKVWGYYHTIDWNSFYDKETFGELLQLLAEEFFPYPPGATPETFGIYIAHNWFGPRPRTFSGDDGEGLQIGLFHSEWMEYNCTVEFNYFQDYDGEVECISVKSTNNLLRWNVFRNSACTLTLRHANSSMVTENYWFCDGKDYCGGVRINGMYNQVYNNYMEDTRWTDGELASVVVYKGKSYDERRMISVNNTVERNVMVDCSRCIVAGWDFEGGDEPPVGTRYIDNVMVARTEDDWAFYEEEQIDEYFEGNIGWIGQISREEEVSPGISREDPGLVFDEELGIWKPTNTDWDFEMTHPPVTQENTGASWL